MKQALTHKKRPRQFGAAEVREGKAMKIKPFKDGCRIRKARLQLFAVCLIDSAYAWQIPACIHLSEYGAFLIMMIQRGMGLESIVAHLEAVGVADACKMLAQALETISDGVSPAPVLWGAVRVLAEGTSVS